MGPALAVIGGKLGAALPLCLWHQPDSHVHRQKRIPRRTHLSGGNHEAAKFFFKRFTNVFASGIGFGMRFKKILSFGFKIESGIRVCHRVGYVHG
ncbi:hypothetical protein [Chelativorans sp.]|uniref:hypothetical protein n=1 Tax=Chelativorans sp. TaxID=2203393 RepID=UPI002810F0FA|nr:hypothetical protein [Chelativorans sp.]